MERQMHCDYIKKRKQGAQMEVRQEKLLMLGRLEFLSFFFFFHKKSAHFFPSKAVLHFDYLVSPQSNSGRPVSPVFVSLGPGLFKTGPGLLFLSVCSFLGGGKPFLFSFSFFCFFA